MKKRSLFAAVAMLIVSAVVLTSATYAWFAGNSNVQVDTISASVDASTGSLQISYNNRDWSKIKITKTDLTYDANDNPYANGVFPTALSPMDFTFNGGTETKRMAAFGTGDNGNVMTLSNGSSNNNYIHFSFWVKASQANTTAYLVPNTFTDGTNFTYMAIKIGSGNWFVYSADGNSYKPLSSDTGTITDDGTDAYIVDSGDTGAAGKVANTETTVGTKDTTTPTNYKYHTLTLGTTSTEIKVMMWAEGQDPQCTAATGSESIQMAFNVTLTQPS